MLSSTSSVESARVSHGVVKLLFSNVEMQRDSHAVIVKCNIANVQPYEQTISSHYFMLVADGLEAAPHVSYISEAHKQGKLWSWKILKPNEKCTVMLRYQHVSHAEQYEFRVLQRQQNEMIKQFYV